MSTPLCQAPPLVSLRLFQCLLTPVSWCSVMDLSYASAAGPLAIMIPLAMVLSGIMIAQMWYYWDRYKDDPLWIKLLAWTLCALETVHSVFCLHILYTYVVTWAGDAFAAAHLAWSSGVTLCLQMAIVFLAQGFYIYRIWQLSEGNLLVTIIPGFLLMCRCAFGIATASFTYRYSFLPAFKANIAVLITVNVGLSLAVVVDFVITGLLIYYLDRRKTPFKETSRLIHSLMFYTINTGALTMIFSTLTVLTFNLVPSSIFACFVEIVSKLYANSALAMLNARKRLKPTSSTGDGHSIPLEFRHTRSTDETEATAEHIQISISHEITMDISGASVLDISADDAQKGKYSIA